MAGREADGEIRVDVIVSEKSFNDSMRDLGKKTKGSFDGLSSSFSKIGNDLKTKIAGKAAAAFAKLKTVAMAALRGISTALIGIGIAIGVVIAAVIVLGFMFLVVLRVVADLIIAAVKFGVTMFKQMAATVSKTSALGQQVQQIEDAFNNVRQAIFTAFSPLITAVLPYIQLITEWIVKAINAIAMLIAHVLGQEKVLQYVLGSADSMGGSIGEAADEAERLNEAAEGALGSFDKLDVLQQHQEVAPGGGGGGGGGGGSWVETNVDTEIWAKMMDWIEARWQEIVDWFWSTDTGQWITDMKKKWDLFWEPFKTVWDAFWADEIWIDFTWDEQDWENLKTAWNDFWHGGVYIPINVGEPGGEAASEITGGQGEGTFGAWLTHTSTKWELWKNEFARDWKAFWKENGTVEWDEKAWSTFFGNIETAWDNHKVWWEENITGPIEEIWDGIMGRFTTKQGEEITNIETGWFGYRRWWTNTMAPILKSDWDTFWVNVKTAAVLGLAKIESVFPGFVGKVKDQLNKIITHLNILLIRLSAAFNALIGLINQLEIDIPSIGFGIPGIHWSPGLSPISGAPQIPYLASGAVIPPNARFMAMLGDQTKGTNIEAPADLIRQIVAEEMAANQGSQEFTFNFAGSLGALVRELKPYIDNENTRVGKSMIRGVT